ncbi:HicB family protein [Spirochaetia bacterium]|nr:HicB family protein [Spirochaetia bacterium]
MKSYIAFFEYVNGKNGKNGYSVVFPDFPGFVTAGDTYEEAYRMAHEGLAAHIKFLEKDNTPVPEPRTMEQIENTWKDWKADNDYIVVSINKLPVVTKARRINIFLNEELLAQIDMVTNNRSEYISKILEHSFS